MSPGRARPTRSIARRARISAEQLLAWRPSWRWLRGVVRSLATSFLALSMSLWLLPGVQATEGAESVASVVVTVLVVGALLRPLITLLTVLTGAVGLLVTGLLAQAAILAVALSLVPTVEPFSWPEIIVASWAAAVAAAVVNWLFDANSDEAFLGQLLGRAVRSTRTAGAEGRGLLVVQLDGVSEPVLRQAIISGAVPTVSRWVRSGSHQLRAWHTGVPATTPAGQAVLLHGDATTVPGFRWWDKDQGRLVAVSRPADAAEIQARMSARSGGRGLLADGGASVLQPLVGRRPHPPAHGQRRAGTGRRPGRRVVRRPALRLPALGHALRRAGRHRVAPGPAPAHPRRGAAGAPRGLVRAAARADHGDPA